MSVRANSLAAQLLTLALLIRQPVIAAEETEGDAEGLSETPCAASPDERASGRGWLDLKSEAECGEQQRALLRTVDAVSLRARPEKAAPRYMVVSLGAVAEKLGQQGEWILVRVDGRSGWVAAEFLEPQSFESTSPPVWLRAVNAAVLRSGSDLSSPRLGVVSTLKRLQHIGQRGEWTRVRFEERGWMHNDYLVAANGLGNRGHLRTTEGVNLRSGPDAKTERINTIGPEQWVVELQRLGDWVNVRVERRGWIHSRILEPWTAANPETAAAAHDANLRSVTKQVGPDSAVLVEEGESRVDQPVLITSAPLPEQASDTGAIAAPKPMRVAANRAAESARAVSTVPPTRDERPTPETVATAAVRAGDGSGAPPAPDLLRTVDAVSLRSQPDRTAPRYQVIGPGGVVEKLGNEGQWFEVRVDGRSGWIDADFLEPLDYVADSQPASVWLQPRQAAVLRSAPGLTSVRLGTVAPGRRVQQMASKEDWTRVRLEDQGWVNKDYLVPAAGLEQRPHLKTTEGVNLRAGPGANTARINAIGPAQWVEELQRVGDWVQVRVERRGWIYSRILEPTADAYLAQEVASPALNSAPISASNPSATATPVPVAEPNPTPAPAQIAEEGPAEDSRSTVGRTVGADGSIAVIADEQDAAEPIVRESRAVRSMPDIEVPCAEPQNPTVSRPGVPVLSYEIDCDTTAVGSPSPDKLMEFPPVPDRWRIVSMLGYPQNLWDPYSGNNPLKGDLPLFGEANDWFFNVLFISDTVYEPRRFPVPVGNPSTLRPGGIDLFGSGRQTVFNQNFLSEFVLYKGDTIYRPPDYEFRFIPVFNYSIVDVDEISLLKPSPGFGLTRREGFVGIQGLFFDKHLRNVSTRYDFDSVRIGIQPFSSDWRGFLFQDNQFGIRLFGTRNNNIYQYNLAWFRRLEKDANSGLNDITERGFGDSLRDDDVFVFNVYRQDFPRLGFFSQLTVLYNRNRESDDIFYEDNGFIQRPASLGTERSRDYDVVYLGYNGDGHFGRNNLTTSFYAAFGDETNTTFTNSPSDIRAWFFAAEYSRDYDWFRPRLSALYGSGDSDPFDGKSQGYDAVFENPQFAGADTSFWIRQGVPLIGGGRVALSGRNGILNSLRSSKEFGQSNFVNPGIVLLGFGADMDLTPELRFSLNANQLWFEDTSSVALARNQANVAKNIGLDISASFIYRPFATQNIVFRASGAALLPGQGYKDLFGDEVPYSILANLVLQY